MAQPKSTGARKSPSWRVGRAGGGRVSRMAQARNGEDTGRERKRPTKTASVNSSLTSRARSRRAPGPQGTRRTSPPAAVRATSSQNPPAAYLKWLARSPKAASTVSALAAR
jgi:hypothetical protein